MTRGEGVRFAAVGLEHVHADILVRTLLDAGATLAAVAEDDDGLYARYAQGWPEAPRRSREQVLADESIELVVTAAVPSERAGIAVAAMEHGKDVLADKPACVSLRELEDVRAAYARSRRHFVVWFGERLYNRAAVHAVSLVRGGAIGDIVHFTGFGPHLLSKDDRPAWHFDPAANGGILVDLACHQIDAFLAFTDAGAATVVAARTANVGHPDLPDFEDVGDLLLHDPEGGALGYGRVDWHTPDGLGLWGDGRTFLVGTAGTLELRRTIDLCGRGPGEHLLLVDDAGPRYLSAADVELPFGEQLVADVRDRTETAMTSAHALAVTELSLQAQELARAGRPFRMEAVLRA